MNNIPKTLLITEGERTEQDFFTRIRDLFNLNMEIINIKANIYKLYNKMKEEDFNCNIKDLLKECCPNNLTTQEKEDYFNKLNNTYAYTYFIFDFDVQHHDNGRKNDVEQNCKKISKMLIELNDETDDTRGKLFINYPMMESFKDIESFDDDDFSYSYINIADVKKYKYIVGLKRIANINIKNYTLNNFIDIFKLNCKKLFFINNEKEQNLSNFYKLSEGNNIYMKIKEKIDKDSTIYVLNTSIFFLSEFKSINQKYLKFL